MALERDTLAGYEEFLAAFPDSRLVMRIRAIVAVRREAITWRRTLNANTPGAYWSYLRRYPEGAHVADAQRRLAILSAAIVPPTTFAAFAYDVPPPPPDEVVYLNQPVILFDGPGFAPAPPPPLFLLPPPPPPLCRPTATPAANRTFFLDGARHSNRFGNVCPSSGFCGCGPAASGAADHHQQYDHHQSAISRRLLLRASFAGRLSATSEFWGSPSAPTCCARTGADPNDGAYGKREIGTADDPSAGPSSSDRCDNDTDCGA